MGVKHKAILEVNSRNAPFKDDNVVTEERDKRPESTNILSKYKVRNEDSLDESAEYSSSSNSFLSKT